MNEPRDGPGRKRTREDYAQGLPDYHDPTAGIGGAPPAQSALTLRLVLAAFGLVFCTVAGFIMLGTALPVVFPVVLFVLAAIAAVDLGVVARRKARGEPG
ncbi:DUF6343 family protein [Geodermatophilus sp. YIM 151500]|uniref:DUF6343 family protein n=1 Tax=Geodermatophilus sp. YIM 151500 TaxID=2984531 RepID=UPI0021E4DCBD|nr:DUF6343 family protein [Geodermatophilus sp. YIM 151500]MCV2490751.1 DUF6343 family protein [Geodermatophilus sp. YIM 151500]